jgi:hypothetical protein
MSAAAKKWLARQCIEGRTLNAVLRVLAEASDKTGRINVSQFGIAQRAGLCERAIRDAMRMLEYAGVVSRLRRAGGARVGRQPDLICLQMDADFRVSKDDLAALKLVGATGTKVPDRAWEQTAKNCSLDDGSNRHEMPVANSAPTTPRGSIYKLSSPPYRVCHLSGRKWPERKRSSWRAHIRFAKVNFDLGRYPDELEATRALGGALADIQHSLNSKSGHPREPIIRSQIDSLQGCNLGDFLFGGGS